MADKLTKAEADYTNQPHLEASGRWRTARASGRKHHPGERRELCKSFIPLHHKMQNGRRRHCVEGMV